MSLIGSGAVVTSRVKLPRNVSWANLKAYQGPVVNQGGCGSCWAVASSNVLRAYSELYSDLRHFSIQQLVSCTPNPYSCGGEGGCDGATVELAFDYVMNSHVVSEDDFRYAANPREPKC